MQLLNAAIDLFMFLASWRRIPSEPVLLKRSEPAKYILSTMLFYDGVSLTATIQKVDSNLF